MENFALLENLRARRQVNMHPLLPPWIPQQIDVQQKNTRRTVSPRMRRQSTKRTVSP